VIDKSSGKPFFPPYAIRRFQGRKVGFIGMTLEGTPSIVAPAASYRITTNNFLADGGDDFLSLKAGTGRTTLSDFDIDSLVRYLAPTLTGAPIGPPALDRIDVTP
jgi:5'-nucleotidase